MVVGAQSRYSFCEYWVGRCCHLVPLLGQHSVEDGADLLAEAVEKHHPGYGLSAYDEAVRMLTTIDFDAYWWNLDDRIQAHKLWGGVVPKAVAFYSDDDPKEGKILVTNSKGVPTVYKARKGALEGILDRPEERRNAVKDSHGDWLAIPPKASVLRNRRERRLRAKLQR